jgi:hypothetical protein
MEFKDLVGEVFLILLFLGIFIGVVIGYKIKGRK